MKNINLSYKDLVSKIYYQGQAVDTRNARTTSLFGESISFDMADGFPLLNGRKMYYGGILGEYAAFLKGPKKNKDFTDEGCNYWQTWAEEDGTLNLDYGNAWIDFNGVNQMAQLLTTLRENPTDRRMLISAWRPDKLKELSLPCCHYAYQFYVRDGCLDMMWHQRSTDVMIGLPSDIILSALMLISIAREVGLEPGKSVMTLGDVHIYESHQDGVVEFLTRDPFITLPKYNYSHEPEPDNTDLRFYPEKFEVLGYAPMSAIKFELHG